METVIKCKEDGVGSKTFKEGNGYPSLYQYLWVRRRLWKAFKYDEKPRAEICYIKEIPDWWKDNIDDDNNNKVMWLTNDADIIEILYLYWK